MLILSVMYPAGNRFDLDYYTQRHMPLVRERWNGMGLREDRLLRGTTGPDGASPSFTLIALLSFGSRQDFEAALGAHGAELLADIKNFTDVQPVIQVSEPIGS